jgi:hypothetical protein
MKICPNCGKRFENPKSYGGHISICGKFKTCEVCGKLITFANYTKHLNSHKETECLNCEKKIHYKRKFCGHRCFAIYSNKGKLRNPKGNNGKIFDCNKHFCLNCEKLLVRKPSTQKYCNNKCGVSYRWKVLKNKIEQSGLFADSDERARGNARKYLTEKFGRHKCMICGLDEWLGKPIPLIVDHIDGDHKNNKIENFRLVCGNCDMQLPTYKGRNKKEGRAWRRKNNKNLAPVAQLVEQKFCKL